jgi:hypothetical protein
MAATVIINETNTVSATVTAISASNYGSVDAPDLDPVANPITPGQNSYEKWQQWDVTSLGGSSQVQNLKFFSTAPATNTAQGFNGNTSQTPYNTTQKTAFATPGTTTANTPNAVPTSAPSSANIGIGGSLTGALSASGSSDYVVSQIQTSGSATAGTTLTNTYRYDEIA